MAGGCWTADALRLFGALACRGIVGFEATVSEDGRLGIEYGLWELLITVSWVGTVGSCCGRDTWGTNCRLWVV